MLFHFIFLLRRFALPHTSLQLNPTNTRRCFHLFWVRFLAQTLSTQRRLGRVPI